MGSTSRQVKSLITLSYDYLWKKTENSLVQLQRHLQILSVVNDLSIFEPTCMETLEFFVCLEQLLAEADPKSSLASKVINLLLHISRSPTVRIAMRDGVQLLPVISNYFLNTKQSKDKSHKVLQLLQELSYGAEIRRLEAWVIHLVPYLISKILECDNGEEVFESSVIILTNICRRNPPVISLLSENRERKKKLFLTLTRLKNSSIRMQLLFAEILLFMNVDDSQFSNEHISHTLDVVFLVATDGFADQNMTLLEHSKDVLDYLVKRTDLEDTLMNYDKFGVNTLNILSYLTEECSPESVGILFHILSSIIQLKHPDVQQLLSSLISKSIPWLPNRKNELGPQKLLQTIVLYADDGVISPHIEDLGQSLKESLSIGDDFRPTVKSFTWIISILELGETLINKDREFLFALAKYLSPPLLSSILKIIMRTMENENLDCLSQTSFSSVNVSALPDSPSDERKRSCERDRQIQAQKSFMESCSEAVVLILSVAKRLSVQNLEFKVECRQMLISEGIMQYIVFCQRSADVKLVSRATSILCEESVPGEILSALVKAQSEANFRGNLYCGTNSLSSSASSSFASCPSEDRIDCLISKLNGVVAKSELKDIPLTEVMDLYEYKLVSLAHNEKNLQEALAATDAEKRQIRIGLLQAKAESAKLRSLLKVWEERVQSIQREKAETSSQIEEIQDSVRTLRKEHAKEKVGLEREILKIKEKVSNSLHEIELKEEEVRRLHRQISEAHTENKAVKKELKQERDQVKKLNETITKMEDDGRKRKRENEELEKDNSRLERVQESLRKKNEELEMLIKSHEQTVVEKEKQLDAIAKENATLKRIKDMIHDISSGKM